MRGSWAVAEVVRVVVGSWKGGPVCPQVHMGGNHPHPNLPPSRGKGEEGRGTVLLLGWGVLEEGEGFLQGRGTGDQEGSAYGRRWFADMGGGFWIRDPSSRGLLRMTCRRKV